MPTESQNSELAFALIEYIETLFRNARRAGQERASATLRNGAKECVREGLFSGSLPPPPSHRERPSSERTAERTRDADSPLAAAGSRVSAGPQAQSRPHQMLFRFVAGLRRDRFAHSGDKFAERAAPSRET